MGRKPASARTPAEELEPGLSGASQEDLDLDDFLNEIGPSISVIHVLRMKPDGSRPQVGKTTMDQIREDPWEFLRSSYGGGKFLLLFRGSDRRIHGSKILEVEGAPVTPTQRPNDSSSTNGTNPENLSFHDRLLLYNFLGSSRPQNDMGAMMAGIAAIMTAVKPNGESKAADPIQMFQTIMQMYQGMKDKNEKSPLDQIRDVAGVIKEFTGDGKDVDSPWGAVAAIGKDLVEKASPILSNLAGVRPVVTEVPLPQQPRPVLPQPEQPKPPIEAKVPADPLASEESLRQWLGTQITFFKEKAKAGKNPGFWIDYIFENAEEPGCQAILYAIRQGVSFQNLLAFDEEIRQNPQLSLWFKEVFDGVQQELRAEADERDLDTRRESGNTSDARSNGGAGKTGQSGTGSAAVSPDVS